MKERREKNVRDKVSRCAPSLLTLDHLLLLLDVCRVPCLNLFLGFHFRLGSVMAS